FLYFLANVYYSEIRAISWQTAALFLDTLAAYFLGRMLFYHRVRAYALVLLLALIAAWLGLFANQHKARQMEKEFHASAEEMLANPPAGMDSAEVNRMADDLFRKAEYQDGVAVQYQPIKRAYLLLICFWLLSTVFLWLEKPSSLAFLV